MKTYLLLLAAAGLMAGQQQNSAPGEPVSVVVTLEPKHGKTIPPIEAQDITVQEGRDKRPVTGFVPLGENPSTQLLLLIDDSARGTFDTEINTLKQFVNALPANTEVAVAYMRNGMASYTSNFTR